MVACSGWPSPRFGARALRACGVMCALADATGVACGADGTNVGAWHWEEKNRMDWVRQRLPEALCGLRADAGAPLDAELSVSRISKIEGHVRALFLPLRTDALLAQNAWAPLRGDCGATRVAQDTGLAMGAGVRIGSEGRQEAGDLRSEAGD